MLKGPSRTFHNKNNNNNYLLIRSGCGGGESQHKLNHSLKSETKIKFNQIQDPDTLVFK